MDSIENLKQLAEKMSTFVNAQKEGYTENQQETLKKCQDIMGEALSEFSKSMASLDTELTSQIDKINKDLNNL